MITAVANSILGAPNFKGKWRLLKALLKRLDGAVVRSRYGVLMRVHWGDFTNWACISGAYARDYDDVFAEVSKLESGMAFVDIGANAGLFSLVASQRVGANGVVLAFEPNPKVFRQLLDHARLNHLSNFHPFEAAISARSGTAFFKAGGRDHTGAGHLDRDGGEEVRVLSFSDTPELRHLIGTRPTVIKVDVEGAEALVVEGLMEFIKSSQVSSVILEIDEKNLERFNSSAAVVYDAMALAGFSGRRRAEGLSHFNEVFTRTTVIESRYAESA